jgi:hypothetical protein
VKDLKLDEQIQILRAEENVCHAIINYEKIRAKYIGHNKQGDKQVELSKNNIKRISVILEIAEMVNNLGKLKER